MPDGGQGWDPDEVGDLLKRVKYTAGAVTGRDVLVREWCASPHEADILSVEDFCTTAKLIVNVSPLNVAQDDDGATMPAKPVTVPVMDNDTFTDTPFMKSSVEILEDTIPADVEVEVNESREVVVTAPARYEGETVEFDYRLTDFTRSSIATVRIQVGEPAVVIPEPTPPVKPKPEPTPPVKPKPEPTPPVTPTPEPTPPATPKPEPTPPAKPEPTPPATPTPEPTPPVKPEPKPPVKPKPAKGPKAKADRGHTMVGLPTTISILKNDRFAGKAQVKLTGVPKGVKAFVTKAGKVKVTAGQRWAGKTVRFGYVLTDKTGKSSKTTVQVQVDPIPIIVTGADRSTPETSTDVETAQSQDSATRVAFVGTGGVLIAVGLVVGMLWLRRSRM